MCGGRLTVRILGGRVFHFPTRPTQTVTFLYCDIQIEDCKQRTGLKMAPNPYWDEEFIFIVDGKFNVLSLCTWQATTSGEGVLMGYGAVSIDDCMERQRSSKTIKILGDLHGEISLEMTAEFETTETMVQKLLERIKWFEENESKHETANQGLRAQNYRLKRERQKFEEEVNTLKFQCKCTGDNDELYTAEDTDRLKSEIIQLRADAENIKRFKVACIWLTSFGVLLASLCL